MARIVSIIQFTGRVGSAVGSKGKNGKILLRQHQPSVANPRTDNQMRVRAKLKLAAQVAGMLGQVGQTSLVANGFRKTERGKLIKKLLENIVVNANGSQASLAYDLHLVDNPSYVEDLSVQIASESNLYRATFSGAGAGEAIAKAIMIHDVTTGLWRHTTSLNKTASIALGKSASENGHQLEVFAYGIVLHPKTENGYNSLAQVGADNGGFILDMSRVSSTDFNFSPTLSAILNVAGDGSSTGGNGGSTAGGSGSEVTPGTGSGGSNTLAAPTLSGTNPFATETSVTMTAASGAEIRYTLDNSTPTSASTLYSAPVSLTETTVVKAIAILGGETSPVATRQFSKSSGGGSDDN